jgi:hypothetical protein
VMEKRGEPLFPIPSCCLPNTLRRAGRTFPAQGPEHIALGRVPLGPCPSLPASAARSGALFGGFCGTTTTRSDFLCSSVIDVRPQTSRCGLVCAKAGTGSPGSRTKCVRAWSQTAQGSLPSRDGDGCDVAFRLVSQRRHPGGEEDFAAQYPAHACPCQRFTFGLTADGA